MALRMARSTQTPSLSHKCKRWATASARVDVNETKAGLVTLRLVVTQQYACSLSPGEVVKAHVSCVFVGVRVSC